MKKYTIVGGNPIRMPNGTTTFTALRIVGQADTREELASLVNLAYEECAGLVLVINNETGTEQTDEPR